MDQFALEAIRVLSYVGATIIKKAVWASRDVKKYFGTGFVHVGVIFDRPVNGDILVTAVPLVSIRHGNAQWGRRAFKIWMFDWPRLVWSFSTISEHAKIATCPKEPWNRLKTLLAQRAVGNYSIHEYRAFLKERLRSRAGRLLAAIVARIPRSLLYVPAYLYARMKLRDSEIFVFDLKIDRS